MGKDLGILTVHGMGEQGEEFLKDFHGTLKRRLGRLAGRVAFEGALYQRHLSPLQREVLRGYQGQWLLGTGLRRLALLILGDAVTYEHRAYQSPSAYEAIHREIRDKLDRLTATLEPDAPIVIIAQSMGGHVVSNFIYDLERTRGPGDTALLERVRMLITTGCNIPIFVSGMQVIRPFTKPNPAFRWINLYSPCDVLGYPLKTLCRGGTRPYAAIVTNDIPVFLGLTPLSHGRYWKWHTSLAVIVRRLRGLL